MVRYCSGFSSKYKKTTSVSHYAELCLDRAIRPLDFSYRHKAERTVSLVLTTLSDRVDEEIPRGLRVVFDASPAGIMLQILLLVCELLMCALGQLPIASLFPTLLYLHNTEQLKKTLEQILELLKSNVDEEPAVPEVFHPSDPFQRHFEILLYRDQELSRLRVKLCVADFCWVWSFF